jgi:hypothetical protein
MEPGDGFRMHSGHELSRTGMRWRSTRAGRPACQIVCRRPTPHPGQRSSSGTAAGGTAGDEANEAVSPDATRSETKTTSMEIPIRDGVADLGSTRDGAGPGPLGDWLLSVDPALALGGGESVSRAGDGPAPAANSDRHNAHRSPRSRWAKSPYCRIRTNPLGMIGIANRRTNSSASSVISLRLQPSA